MVDSVQIGELSWPEFEAKVGAGAPVFLPLGTTEQHGPHLPLATDVILPSAVAAAVAKEVGGLVAPALVYGYKSMPRCGGGEHFPGTTSVEAHTFTLTVRDVILNLGLHGVRKLVIVNGHFENSWPAIEGLDLARRELRHEGIKDFEAIRLDYWDFITKETIATLFPDGYPGSDLEHASLMETSLMLAVRPDLVDMSKVPSDGPAKFPTYDRWPLRPGLVPPSGVLNDARGAKPEFGKLLLNDHVTLIAAAVRKEFAL
ncbi:creatininase [Zavarzinia sp. CC-PAN008]|uniref:creatininase n=1 Tax=Zavarzinia sp. CC-PAN008 TaxID=3243332 RepID=UPI003F7480D8